MSHDSQFAINHFLRSNGLGDLSQAGALMTQLAFFVRDHAHFLALLIACEPKERHHMYDAIAPNLRFKAKPFATYLIEAAQDAERRQLPTIGEDGHFRPFRAPEVKTEPAGSDAAIATAAAIEAVAKARLWMVCALCTTEDVFRGITKEDAVRDARKAGWRLGFKKSDTPEIESVEVCPRCVKARAPKMHAA